jgi:hypothetical protein
MDIGRARSGYTSISQFVIHFTIRNSSTEAADRFQTGPERPRGPWRRAIPEIRDAPERFPPAGIS